MKLRVLLIEDMPDDAALMLRRLRQGGIDPQWARVDTAAALREALAGEQWQVALVDFSLPGFSGPEALAILAELAPGMPAITVSGAISEETAVATITAGAVDYVLKGNLTRLTPAVLRAVEGAELRRKERQATARARQTMYAIEHSSQAIFYVSEHGVILYANLASGGLGGRSPADLVGQPFWAWSQAVDEARWAELWRAAAQNPIVDFEAVVRLAGGEERLVAATLDHHERDEDSFVIVYARDITARKRAEEELVQSRDLLANLARLVPGVVYQYRLNPDGTSAFPYSSLGMNDIYECTPEEVREDATPVFERLHPEDAERVGDLIQESARTLDEFYCEFRVVLPRQGLRWRWSQAHPERMEDGGTLWHGIISDITERKQAEDALRQSEEQFRRFAEYLPGLLTIKDAKLRYIFGNNERTAERSIPSAQWIGKTPEELWSPEEARGTRETGERVLSGEVVEEVSELTSDRGKGYWRSVHFPISRGAEPPLVGGISIDVTEQYEAQEEILRNADQLRRTVEGAVLALSLVVETRDPYTAGHERRVSELATAIAVQMGMAGEQLTALRLGGLIHDVGKVAVPAEILSKPGRLSEVELDLIKQHPRSGFDILGAIDFGLPVAEMVLQHHERLDGSGYPRGLVGEAVLPEARILAVADVVEAMSSHRPYRPALGMEAALAEIRAHAGVRYDAEVVTACVRLVEEQGFAFTL